MARAANCPSCGAQVAFRAAASVLAVCEYCRSTLLRKGADLENLGKMADLAEDASLVRLGTEGRYQGVHFAVVGRIQLQYGKGIWNEWHLLYDSRRSGWLGEGYGRTFVTSLKAVKEPIPPFSELKVGATVKLDGKSFTVAGLETARCIAGEGELPFEVGAGYDVQTADLYGGAYFATIDYSETPPFVFIGEQVEPATLKLTHTRDPAAMMVAAEAIKCTGCGAPLTVHGPAIETVACGTCGAVLDATDRAYKVVQQIKAQRLVAPRLPLGAKGRLHGAEYEVIGYMIRKIEVVGEAYRWGEYLLFNPVEGFRWLTEYGGHWNFTKATRHPPALAGGNTARYLGQTFKHFQGSQPEVEYVAGEFYWQVRVGDTNHLDDYVNPPLLLSAEGTDKEMVWSVSEYTEPETVAKAFGLKVPLPDRRGVFANQPAPVVAGRYWGVFTLMAVAALLIHAVFSFGGGAKVYEKVLWVPPRGEHALETEMFDVKGRPTNLVVRNSTDLYNGWAYFSLSLVDAEKGAVYRVGREISYYAGSDWSEGNRSDEAVFSRIPAGRYYLSIDAEVHPERSNALQASLQVLRDVPSTLNLWLLLGLLAVIPVYMFYRKSSFEIARWAESDHPLVTEGDSDDS
jgi:ribosomal protein S27E